MPTTTKLQLPYPSLSSAPNVPQDIQALAQKIEDNSTTAWTTLTLASGFTNWTGTTGPAPAYRIVGTKVQIIFWVQKTSGSFTVGTDAVICAAGALPVAARPVNRNVLRWGHSQWSTTTAPLIYITVKPDGSLTVNPASSGTAPTWVMGDIEYEPGL